MSRSGKRSAGLLLYRRSAGILEVFLVHPGGPYWVRKDDGAWSIPKGEAAEGVDLLKTAYTEFHEETGSPLHGRPVPLEPLKQAGGKVVHAWAVQGEIDAASIRSNTPPQRVTMSAIRSPKTPFTQTATVSPGSMVTRGG